MTIFKLRNRETNWGDYGDILVSGMTGHLDRANGLLQLERTGPYVPPLVKSGVWDIVMTDETKRKLATSGLAGIGFMPVIKKHIVYLDWGSWDLQSEEPLHYPDSGEPEGYILGAMHSESISKEMGDLWELVVPVTGTFQDNKFISNGITADIFKADNKGYILVTENAMSWIEQNAGEWVAFGRLR